MLTLFCYLFHFILNLYLTLLFTCVIILKGD
nr:MAG TPA: hypothetical protein [Caudoviricetes sp.]